MLEFFRRISGLSQSKKAKVSNTLFEPLEDRTLFDATAMVSNGVGEEPILPEAEATVVVPVLPAEHTDQQQEQSQSEDSNGRLEYVFVDTTVEGYQTLVDGFLQQGPNISVVLLNQVDDGLSQISQVLSQAKDVSAIHLISHGDSAKLQIGNGTLDFDNLSDAQVAQLFAIGESLSEDADLLIYGCNFAQGTDGLRAANSLAKLTGADVAASNNLTGLESLGGDWVLEETIGSIETSIVVGLEAQESFMGTLALADATLSIISDGTPTWDGNNNAGNDTDGSNGIIRSHDAISMEVFYNTDSNGATDLNFTSTLPEGLVWDFLPAAAALDSRSMIVDSVTGLEGGDMRSIIAYLPDVSGTFTSSVAFEARALGGEQGTALDDVTFSVNANENATAIDTAEFDFVLSSAANMDIELLAPTFRGAFDDLSGNPGVVYSYGIGILGDHPTRSGADGVKGAAPIQDDFTFDIDLTNVSAGATVFDWGATLGTNSQYGDDGLTRNYERFTSLAGSEATVWSNSSRPSGRTLEHPTSVTWSAEHSTPDSGDWNITGSSGGVFSAQVSGSDTTGTHFPDFGAGNRVIPASDYWFTSSMVHVWIPLADILPGEDGITGTTDDGVLTVVPEITNFDPDDAYGVTNNFGAGTEDTSNNDYSHQVVSFRLGGPTKYNSQAGHPTSGRWVDTSSSWAAGDGETSLGHQYDARVSSGQNQGVLGLSGIIFGDKFDNTATKIVPNSLPGKSGDGWSRIYSSGGPFSGTHLAYGTDYIIEFATGGVDGDPAGWTDWNSMGDASLADDQTSTVWTEDPTDAALGGTADPTTNVRDSITKWRIKLLRDLEPGETLISLITMETFGPSTIDPVNNPNQDIIANFVASTGDLYSGSANPWYGSEYDPLTNTWYAEGSSGHILRGDRLILVEANVEIDKSVLDLGAGNSYLAGSAATIQLEGTVTIPGPDSGLPAQDVYVTDMLPAGLTVVGGSAQPPAGFAYTTGDGSVQTVQSVEYWDGSSWSTTWSYGASGVRWYFGDVPLNTVLPLMTFDVLIPFDAENGQSWTNTAVISSPSDTSPEELRNSSAGLVAVQVAAMSAGKFVVTPLVPEDTTIIYELGIANVSDDKDVPWFDLVDLLPYDADFEGSNINGVYTDVNITGLDPDLFVYVTTVAPGVLDAADGTVDGFADPGTAAAGNAWFVAEGTGIWSYTLADVQAGVAGAPAMGDITGIRVVSDKSVDPFLGPGESTKFQLELTPDGNIGIPSDNYTNKFTARTDPGALPLPVTSAAVTATVIAPDIEIQKEVALDETHTNIDPADDSHWVETVNFDDTDKAYFRVKVTNTGTADFLGATVTDNLPAGATLVAGTAVASTGDTSGFPATWTFDLAAGDTAYLIYQIDVNDAGNYPNTATVDATDQFGESVDDTDDAEANFVTEISAAKQQTGAVRSTSNPDVFEVTYEVEVMNTSIFDLADITLTEDLFGAFGAGYIGLLTPPAITASSISAGGTSPSLNGGYDGNDSGTGDDQILNGDGILKTTDSITITYVVLIDPLLLPDPANTVNQVEAGGVTGGPGGTPVTDLSDDGSDPTTDNPGERGDDGMGGVDDPTPLALPAIDLTKQIIGAPVPANSGVNGNFDVTYEFTVENTGTTNLDNISLTEDFLANFGNAFVGVTSGPVVTFTDATDNPDLNLDYDGGLTDPGVFQNTPNTDTFTYGGSTSNTTTRALYFGDQSVVIDPYQAYTLSVDAFAGDGAGGSFDAAAGHYLGFVSYDIDGNVINPYSYAKYAGSTDTTLAAPLNPGDTTITLTDATGWSNGGGNQTRTIAWYGYSDSTGYTYPDYEYTRNYVATAWDAGGLSGNTITLNSPWAGPALGVGDAVRNSTSGGSYQYVLLSAGAVPQTTTSYSTTIGGGFIPDGALGTSLFRPGTHSISSLVLADWLSGGTGTPLNVSNFQLEAPNMNLLEPGQKVTFQITVEVDPDAPGAIYDSITGDGNGSLENQATVDAEDPWNNGPVGDTSDDPTDPTDAEYGDDSDPDDPTSLLFPNIELTKAIVGTPVAATSGTFGNMDVTFEFEISNTGNESIEDLSLMEDLLAQYGGAFVRIVPQGGAPATVTFTDATDGIEINSAFDGGTTDAELIDSTTGTNELAVGESIRIQIVVEVDPDSTTALYTSGMLVNQAMVMGAGTQSGVKTDDDSDDPNDATDDDNDDDNDPDDPTTWEIPIIDLTKTLVGAPVPASSGTSGNFDVTYDFAITNYGNAAMDMLSLVEDVRDQYGLAFVGIVQQAGVVATIQSSSMTDAPEINASYDGGISDDEVFDNSGANTNLIAMGESVTIRIIFEVDPDAVGAIYDGNGNLVNQATTSGNHDGTSYTDESDDPNDATDDDPNSDNNPDDPNLLRIPDINLIKQVSTTTPPVKQLDGSWNVTFELEMSNTGTTVLDTLVLLDDVSSPSFLGPAWLSTISTSIDNTGVTTGDLPALNGGWDTDPTQNMLDGNGSMNVGDSIIVTFTVNIDPDASGASSILYNQATVTGEDPVSGAPVDDASDDPTDGTDDDPDNDNNPDDPTAIQFSDIGVAKQINSVVDLGTGMWSVEYVVVVENTGTIDLDNIQVTDDMVAEFGLGFAGVLVAPAITSSNLSTGSFVPAANAAFDGDGGSDPNLLVAGGLLAPGDNFTITFTVELDTVAGDTTGAGDFSNQVTATGDGSNGQPTSDDSDNGTNPNTDNGGGGIDDPTPFKTPQIRAGKTHGVAAQNGNGTYTVPVTIIIENTGNVPLTNLNLFEDIATQFGNAYIGVANPSIQAVGAFTGTLPTLNTAWTTSDTAPNVIDTTVPNELVDGEAFTFTFNVIVDPDAIDGASQFNDNQVDVSGTGENYDGTPVVVDDQSGNTDDPSSGTDNDLPTPLIIPEVILEKSFVSQTLASSGTAGNIDVTYEFVLTNSGTVTLENLGIFDDWDTQFGAAFVGVVDVDLSNGDVVRPPTSGVNGNTNYTGLATDNMLDALGELLPGESVTVTLTVEVDPDGEPALLVNGQLVNQADASGDYDDPSTPGVDATVTDESDDPTDATDNDTEGDGEGDDPTTISVASVELSKDIVSIDPAASLTSGNFDVTFELVVNNTGTETLSNLSVLDDLQTHFGGAFQGVVSISVANTGGTTTMPVANSGYTGIGASDMLIGAAGDALESGQSFTITLVVEMDPDSPTAVMDSVTGDGTNDFENSATVEADSQYSGPVDDISDDTSDLTDGDDPTDPDNEGDDPTSFDLPDIDLIKELVAPPVAAASGVEGNLDVTYDLTITNTGNADLDMLSLVEDLQANYGGAFVGLIAQGAGFASITGTDAFDAPEVNLSYDGTTANSQIFDNTSGNTNLLRTSEYITVRIIIEIDPDSPTAIYSNGALVNQATTSGNHDGETVSDDSDDPSVNNGTDNDGDNNPDDPNALRVPLISLDKQVVGAPVHASSGIANNWDVTYQLVISNTGTTQLDMMTLTEDFAANFGGAFVMVVTPPQVTASTAADDPEFNSAYDGGLSDAQMFDNIGANTNLLNVGESVTIQVVVEIDPDNAGAIYDGISSDGSGDLENQASVTGEDPVTGTQVDDNSDDPTDATDNNDDPTDDNDPDDPTGLLIPDIELIKTLVADPVPSASGTEGNFDVTYDLMINNVGNAPLDMVTLADDLATQYGDAFVGIVLQSGAPAQIMSSTAADDPEINAAYDGGTSDAQIFDNSGSNINQLLTDQSVTIRIVIEIDPDAVGAVYDGNGNLVNQASTTGNHDGTTVDDLSDDPTDTSDDSNDGGNDADDPNPLRIPLISLEKEVTGTPVPATSGTSGNWDVTYAFTITNTGTTQLDMLQLTEDFAANFGGAFVGIVTGPQVFASTASDDPEFNSLFDGGLSDATLFDNAGGNTNLLEVGEEVTIHVVIEIDPDNATAIYDSISADGDHDLENQASVTGEDPLTGEIVDDNSDDPTDATDNNDDPTSDNDPDDPTDLHIPQIELLKTLVGQPEPATSGISGNFELTYDLEIVNTGTTELNMLTLTDDLLTQYGGAFVQIVPQSGAPVTIQSSTATDDPGINAAYDGGTSNANLFDATASQLLTGETITVRIVIEVDPDAAGATYVSGSLENQAETTGTDEYGETVDDLSDDPNDFADDNSDPTDDNDPDDPNNVRIPLISLEKELVGTPVVATSGVNGNWDATYQFTISNTGTTQLDVLQLTEDFAANFGGAFVTVVTPPAITASTAADVPEFNTAYDGGLSDADLFDNTGANTNLLNVGETITIQIVIEVDPDNATAVYDSISSDGNNDLENQASVTGEDPVTGIEVDDNSDDPTDATDNNDDPTDDNDADDPTAFTVPDITLNKTLVGSPVAATSGVIGNWEVTYDLEFLNNGNEPLDQLSLIENLVANYGTAFVQIVPQGGAPATIIASTATDAIEINAAYDGGLADAQLIDSASGTNLVEAGQAVTIRIVIEIDPDAPGAIYDGSGNLENQATVSGTAPDGDVVTDLSDDTADNENEGSTDNDPDDPNLIRIPMISLDKSIVGAPVVASSGTAYNWDVTYELVITNTGSTQLDMMTLTEDFVANFGGAFVGIVTAPSITVSTAADAPEFNGTYDGGFSDGQMFDNSGTNTNLLNVGESITIQMVVEVDPDNATAVFDSVTGDDTGDLENQASVTGVDPETGDTVDDDSDDPTDAANDNNNSDPDPDDPTGLTIPQISLTKTLRGAPTPAASGTIDNWDVTYDLQITNTGNDFLSSLSLIEDLQTQYGGAFVQIVARPSGSPAAIISSTATDPIEINAAYDGGLSDAELIDSVGGTNLLMTGETITIRIVIEIDPDGAGAVYTDGELVNQANTSGTGGTTGTTVDDDSDDPNDPTDGSTDGADNDADDPNTLRMPDISLEKTVVATAPAASGVYANYDVTFQFIVQNTGTTPLDALTLTDDWSAQFGNAFIRVVPSTITVIDVDAATVPGANTAYTGAGTENMLDGTGAFDPGQSFIVTVVVEVDPNAAGAIYTNGDLVNQATTTANDSGDPGSGPVTDLSDDTNNGDDADPNGDGNPDDPTTVSFSDIGLAKRIVISEPNGSGQFELTYELRLRNLGTTDLNNLVLTDDIASSLGPAFLDVIGVPVIMSSTAASDPGINTSFDGVGDLDLFDGTSGLLQPGEEIVVRFVILMDIDQLTIDSNNQSIVSGDDGRGGGPVTDESDTGSDPEGTNPNQTGDTGGENDPTLPPAVGIAKDHGTPTPAGPDLQEWSVPVTLNIRNLGLTDLVNINLIEDVAAQFGSAFVSVDSLAIDATGVTLGTAPGVNNAWMSDTSLNALDGNGLLRPGDFLVVTFNVIVDPDNGGTSMALDNQSTITASDPDNPDLLVIDTSDSGTDPAGSNVGEEGDTGLTEDPTPLVIPDIGLAKQIVNVDQDGLDYDLTINLVFENTGTVDLMNLQLLDDLATQYGNEFVEILVAPSIISSNATTDPVLNAGYASDTSQNMFDGASGLLKPGEAMVIQFVVRTTPDFTDPNFSGTMTLINQAQAVGDDPYGNQATDDSDSGSDPNGRNPGSPGDTGSWADATPITLDVFAFDSFTNEHTQENFGNQQSDEEGNRRPIHKRIFSMTQDLMFSGFARPGTQIVGRIYDFQGNQIGENRVYTDPGGNWMMQMHELRAFEHYHVTFEHVSTGTLDVYGYLGLDPADNTYQTMDMEAWSNYKEPLTVEGAIQKAASKQVRFDHLVNNRPLGLGSQSQHDDDRGYHGDRGRD